MAESMSNNQRCLLDLHARKKNNLITSYARCHYVLISSFKSLIDDKRLFTIGKKKYWHHQGISSLVLIHTNLQLDSVEDKMLFCSNDTRHQKVMDACKTVFVEGAN